MLMQNTSCGKTMTSISTFNAVTISSTSPSTLLHHHTHRLYSVTPFNIRHRYLPLRSALPFDLSPPPIDHDDDFDLLTATGMDVSENEINVTFANTEEALDAVNNTVAVVDLSQFGRIRVSGQDRVQFLHNQSTANFESLQAGQGCDTVFVTATARTIDLAHAWIMKNAIMLVVSPEMAENITRMLEKYIFFADKVEIQDITKQTSLFVVIGPKSNKLMEDLNLSDMVGQPYGSHKHYTVNGMPLTVAVGNVISEEGFSFLTTPEASTSVWKAILNHGVIPIDPNDWETLRILQGRPAPAKELTDEFNVLEAGLWNAISLNKGCYKGQETVARLVTYDGVKQNLWGINLSSHANPGSMITVDGKKVGKLTSYTDGTKTSGAFGLGYIKRKAASRGGSVIVGENVVGTLVEVPFLKKQNPPS